MIFTNYNWVTIENRVILIVCIIGLILWINTTKTQAGIIKVIIQVDPILNNQGMVRNESRFGEAEEDLV